ncbi:mitochondrial inner membrane protease subunit 1 [Tribonema minus]|uniref:Mitochondrial inner membrane protease subunit 2 n=1 Tax=Tribonema minus TaxID=303371 RepID=A0A835YXJ5_9STRA|nr:mitochondrial inner membrane protease subunit 1 [Tribonema minus]
MIVMKRIVGLPGDTVSYHCCLTTCRAPLVVPPGHLWLEGDNKAKSIDSRDYGPVPMALVTGRSVAVVWPPSRMQFV